MKHSFLRFLQAKSKKISKEIPAKKRCIKFAKPGKTKDF
jgi:hypothetical protein